MPRPTDKVSLVKFSVTESGCSEAMNGVFHCFTQLIPVTEAQQSSDRIFTVPYQRFSDHRIFVIKSVSSNLKLTVTVLRITVELEHTTECVHI